MNSVIYRSCVVAAALVVMSGASAACADVIYNEAIDGDFSGDRFAPTQLQLQPGSNELFGVLAGSKKKGIDRDYYSITIPEGHVLAQLNLRAYDSFDAVAFIGIQPGDTFPNDPDSVGPGDLMGWVHFGSSELGLDILPIMGSNGQGFTPPLPAGTYTFWSQQIGKQAEYAFDFVVEVPAPSGVAIMLSSMILVCKRRRSH